MNIDQKKLSFFLPNTFTALNIGCGFFSILLTMKGNIYLAAIFIAIGVIFDSLDGRIARLTGTQSLFGEQFDSLSDLLTFGAAPALLFYNHFLVNFNRLGMITAFVFLLCGALRLARFNANIGKVPSDYFQGLPIPAAALAMVGMVLCSLDYPEYFTLKIFLIAYPWIYALFMISNIPFYSFKNATFLTKNKKLAFLMILAIIYSVFLYEQVVIFAIINAYILISFIIFFKNRSSFKKLEILGDEDADE